MFASSLGDLQSVCGRMTLETSNIQQGEGGEHRDALKPHSYSLGHHKAFDDHK